MDIIEATVAAESAYLPHLPLDLQFMVTKSKAKRHETLGEPNTIEIKNEIDRYDRE